MTDKLKIFLKNFADFEEQELDRIVGFFKPKSVKKNDILLHEGNVSREFYYVHTGGIRTFFNGKNGYEKTSTEVTHTRSIYYCPTDDVFSLFKS